MATKDLMSTARGRIAIYAGFFLALGSKMQWKPDKNCPGGVAATDGLRVLYNPDNLNARPLGEVVFIAMHEIGHPMLAQLRPHGTRDPMLANIAKDVVLNEILAKIAKDNPHMGMIVPADACTWEKFQMPELRGKTWEAVYELLKKKAKSGGGKGEKTINGQGLKEFDAHLDPTDDNGKPFDKEQRDALEKEWKMRVQSAAVVAKQMGKLPGCLEELIGDMITPKVDWETHLRHAVTRVTKDESSYRRFNRRHVSRGLYMPGQYSERINGLAYFTDTSGSIGTDEFKAALGSMTKLLEDFKPDRIYFGQCDTRLHSVDELTPDDLPLPPLSVKGRGGTDMAEAFQWACEHEQDIDLFILQTDGYIPALDPKLIPNVPVVWIITTDAALPASCDFGTHVRVVL